MNRIKKLRQKNNLTLKELGKKVGMKDNTISQYENGKREPKLETWKKLADYFDVSVPYLQGIESNLNPKTVFKKLIPDLHKEYFDNYLLLSDRIPKHSFRINPQITTTLDRLITIKEIKKKPIDFYSKSESEFNLNSEIEKYWFDLLITYIKDMVNSGLSNDNYVSVDIFIIFLNQKLKNYSAKKHEISPLESYLISYHYFDFEEALHHLMNTSIEYSNFEEAKKNFNRYFDYLNEIKTSIFSKNEDELLEKAFVSRAKMESRYCDKSTIRKIKKQFDNGDKKMARFLIGTGRNWEDAYKSYQLKNK